MKLFSILAASLMAMATAADITFTTCDPAGKTPVVKIVSVSVDKEIKVGATITVTATAESTAAIASGSADYSVTFDGIKLASGSKDICEAASKVGKTCPIPATGGPQTFTQTVTLPKELIAGSYKANISANDAAGNYLFCFNVDLTVHLFASFRGELSDY